METLYLQGKGNVRFQDSTSLTCTVPVLLHGERQADISVLRTVLVFEKPKQTLNK